MHTRRWIPTVAFTLLWVTAASISPETTYHLAPLIVAATPAVTGRSHRFASAVAGTVFATGVATYLAATGRLAGPSLLPFGGALVESMLGAIVGGATGLALAGRFSAEVSAFRR